MPLPRRTLQGRNYEVRAGSSPSFFRGLVDCMEVGPDVLWPPAHTMYMMYLYYSLLVTYVGRLALTSAERTDGHVHSYILTVRQSDTYARCEIQDAN